MVLTERRKVEFPFLYSKDGNLIHIVAELKDDPAALVSLLTFLSSKVSLIGTESYSTGEGTAIFSGIGKIISKSETADSIRTWIGESNLVLSSRITHDNQGLLVDSFHHGFMSVDGEACILLPAQVFTGTIEDLIDIFHSGGEAIVYNQGLSYAKRRWATLKAIVPNAASRFDEISNMVAAIGWAVVKITYEAGHRRLRLVNTECFECFGHTKRAGGCFFLKGMAVGLAESVFGREMNGEETKCMKKGDDTCEFVITAKDGERLVTNPE